MITTARMRDIQVQWSAGRERLNYLHGQDTTFFGDKHGRRSCDTFRPAYLTFQLEKGGSAVAVLAHQLGDL
jgi:hypothetical protein